MSSEPRAHFYINVGMALSNVVYPPSIRRKLIRDITAIEKVTTPRTREVKTHHFQCVSELTIAILNMACKNDVSNLDDLAI